MIANKIKIDKEAINILEKANKKILNSMTKKELIEFIEGEENYIYFLTKKIERKNKMILIITAIALLILIVGGLI